MRSFGTIRLKVRSSLDDRLVLEGVVFKNLLLWSPRLGEAITVLDACNRLFRARLIELGAQTAVIHVFEDAGPLDCLETGITLLSALPDKERFELIIQKTTELGVDAIVPFKSEKSISLEQRESRQKKAHKWQETALKAAKQSRRHSIPEVLPYTDFHGALKEADGATVKLLLWEKRQGREHIKDALKAVKIREGLNVAVLSGPEGGFEDKEVEEARASGFVPVSLGPNILRAETAAIFAIGLIKYELSA